MRSAGNDLEDFAREIVEVGRIARESLGDSADVTYLRALVFFNVFFHASGRLFLHFSFEPISFMLGSLLLSLHFNLEVTLAHNCGHGAFNSLSGSNVLGQFSSTRYQAKNMPASIEGWKYVHNKLHHRHTNVIGKDPDIGFESFRVTSLQGMPLLRHRLQLISLAVVTLPMVLILGFRTFWYEEKSRQTTSEVASGGVLMRVLLAPLYKTRYYLLNMVIFPVLAGLCFASTTHALTVLAGNILAECMRGLSYGLMFHFGHHSGTVQYFKEETLLPGKAAWFKRQVESSHNVKMRGPLKHLFGALDLQIEHHLFPNLPPNKLYKIQPQIESICTRYGVHYSQASYFKSAYLCLKNYVRHSSIH